MFIMLKIKDIISAITTIELVLAPNHIMIRGPRATLGRELIIVKYGSTISEIVLLSHKRDAIINPIIEAIEKLINVSYSVIHM